ncbi:DUF6644 family protein [Rhizobium sullae]|uniref:DUF6644 domain-containing protein n=1 Tax=Rhizobium sullae TaxID=50338 RepID=A0A4R3QCA2_RHISU|nr:DUF6644 family protein [Rhizobium sullae]TCU19170.1 hypothetical protein EV132_102401 [Rhizobium sullae]
MTIALLEWLAATPLAVALRRSALLYMFVNASHILSIGLLIGAILPLDLKLMGFFPSVPLSVVGPFLSRAAAIGLAAAIVTGFCLFSVRPMEYAGNPAFLAKIGLLALGVLNAGIAHAGYAWRKSIAGAVTAARLRMGALFSAMIWLAAVVAGRWIGFI